MLLKIPATRTPFGALKCVALIVKILGIDHVVLFNFGGLYTFYLHLQDVGNSPNRVTLKPYLSPKMKYIKFPPKWECLGTQFRPQYDPDLGPRFGTPIWDPDLGPRFGTPIWDPDLGPQFRTPIWDPDLGPRYGTLIWTPNMDP
jgi:hypothetical protein